MGLFHCNTQWLGNGRTIRRSNPGRSNRFISFPKRPNRFLLYGQRRPSPQRREFRLKLRPKLWISATVPQFPYKPLWRVQGQQYVYPLLQYGNQLTNPLPTNRISNCSICDIVLPSPSKLSQNAPKERLIYLYIAFKSGTFYKRKRCEEDGNTWIIE